MLFIICFSLRGNYILLIKKYSSLFPLILAFLLIIVISFIHYAPEASIITRMQHFLTLSLLSVYSVLIYEFLLKIKVSKYYKVYIIVFILIFSTHSYYNFNNLFLKIKSNQETLNLNFTTESINKLNKIAGNKYIIFKKNNSDLSVFKSIFTNFL